MDSVSMEVPEYGHWVYISGKKPHWKVGDTLACYDHEGMVELVDGKVTSVEYSDYLDDWEYTFEDGHSCDEASLVSQETYSRR